LVAWGTWGATTYSSSILGVRVNPGSSAQIIDVPPVPLSAAYKGNPTLASDGVDFFYTNENQGNYSFQTTVGAAWVSAALDAVTPVSVPSWQSDMPRVTFNGSEYVIDSRCNALRVSPGGAVLDPSPVPICSGLDPYGGIYHTAVASNGADTLLV